MKAWVLNKIGSITLEDTDMPKPGPAEVLISVKAAGICGSDIPRIFETGAHKMPLIPGHEFSGVVAGLGEEVDKKWLGKRVAIFPKIPCGKCRACAGGNPDMCTDYDYVGSRRNGAFAEYVTAPAANLIELPENVGTDTAAMTEPMAVAANAVRTGLKGLTSAKDKERAVAVCGLGTIGLMVVMFLKEAGFCNIYAIGNKESQRAKAAAFGITDEAFCNSKKEDAAGWLNLKTGGVSVFFECVGSNDSINTGIESTGAGGRLVLVGNPYSDMSFSRNTYWKILRNQLTVTGIWNSRFRQEIPENTEDLDDWNYVIGKLRDGAISPEKLITHRLPVEDLNKGFFIMKDKTEDYTKILMVNKD